MDEIHYQNEIGNLFHDLELHIQKNDIERVDIRFPRGVLRTANYFRGELFFIDEYTFKTNLAYHLMLTDLYRWLLNRFDLRFTAQEMIIKEGICIIGGISGDISQHIAKKIIENERPGEIPGVNGSLSILRDNNVINDELRNELKYLWGRRNKLHLSTVRMREYDVYDLDKYNEAVNTWKRFKIELQKSKRAGIIR